MNSRAVDLKDMFSEEPVVAEVGVDTTGGEGMPLENTGLFVLLRRKSNWK